MWGGHFSTSAFGGLQLKTSFYIASYTNIVLKVCCFVSRCLRYQYGCSFHEVKLKKTNNLLHFFVNFRKQGYILNLECILLNKFYSLLFGIIIYHIHHIEHNSYQSFP